jgi:transposase-like protein
MDSRVGNQNKRGSDRRYSSDEVADIIRLSLQDENRQRSDDFVDYDELLAIAKDVGVDSSQIDRAVQLLEEEQQARDKEQFLWLRFKTHTLLFAVTNLLLITVNLISGSDSFWAMYVVFGWGLFLLGHYAGIRYAPQFVEIAMQRTREMANNKYQNLFDSEDQVLISTSDAMGMTETSGMISLEEDQLMLEYQTIDAMLGVIKTGVKTVSIPLSGLSSARVEQKLWSAELVLQGKTMRLFGNAPGTKAGQLRVKINRQSLAAANALVEEIKSRLAEKTTQDQATIP